ncbi:MAG: prenyltransferase [Chloroflexota bacterium]|nr:geranylgeranylglycerol-phosphate geranylgeranyltransferase [Ardenticatenaceae bacterium]GIK58204.1 MAG: prenyltransferase [Chloroflexota bacterium]
MLRELKGLFKLGRPLTSLTGGLAVLLGGYVAGTGAGAQIGLATLATFLISMAANAWNDYLDIEIDRINQPQRPLPAGVVNPRSAWLFSLALTLASLLIAAFINPAAFAIALVSTILLYLYSWKFKSTILFGNFTIAAISAMSAVFGGVAAGNVRPSLWLAAVILTAIMGREILKTLADYEGDLHHRCRTIATAWGRRPARIIFFLLAAVTIVMMMMPYHFGGYRPIYALVVVVGVYPVLLYVLLRLTRYRTGPQLERLSQLMKYDFLVWFTAVLLGAQSATHF